MSINLKESTGNCIALDKQLIIESNELIQGVTYKPSSRWTGNDYLIKLRPPLRDVTRHTGLNPVIQMMAICVDGDYIAQGILMDRVTGSWFQGLTITNCVGTALNMNRVKETNFYALTISNCSSGESDVLVDMTNSQVNPKTSIDGCNNNLFSGGRLVNNEHRVYMQMDSLRHSSVCRKNTLFKMQFHIPPPTAYLGIPKPEHIRRRPDRIMLEVGKRASENSILYCNFTYDGELAHSDVGRSNLFEGCTYHKP